MRPHFGVNSASLARAKRTATTLRVLHNLRARGPQQGQADNLPLETKILLPVLITLGVLSVRSSPDIEARPLSVAVGHLVLVR